MVRNNKGAVLLVTLWILAILALLAVGIGFRASLELRLLGYQMNNLKVYEIAKAGVIKAITELEKDETTDTDTIWECGIALKPDETQEEKFKDIRIGDGYFEVSYVNEAGDKIYGIEDVRAKININTASGDVLQRLSPEITEDIAANIRAWRGDEEGIEAADYSDKPYSCKNALFDVVGELLLVKDVTSEIFYGTPEGETEAAINNLITTYDPSGEFKININTAGRRVLESLGLGDSAQNIVNHRAGEDGYIMTSDDNKVFSDIG
ncbi:MAG: general secretion pathway protein GspK, partial [Candidatus Omnitrophica bacterium]|nr:general secretion pathway protein GspK [Candidatus Omnitrophota bacterium]